MKLFLFILTALLLGSCSSNYSHKITVKKAITIFSNSSETKDYELLSVRGDSVIAVLDWSEHNEKPIPFSHVELMRNDSISFISCETKRFGQPTWSGTAIGAGIGGLFGLIFGYSSGSSDGFGAGKPSQSFGVFLFCAGIGTAIGCLISMLPSDKNYFLSSDSSRESLRQISLYPDQEPDEMKYIK